ncbi:MAG: LytTR family DNA-binding domain-containing protein [Bacteroidota bacterium]
MSLRAIIVDDETSVIDDLMGMLQLYCPQVEVIATSTSSQDALKSIQAHRPDLVFLDINIDQKSGLDIAAELNVPHIHYIFVTAYQQYAVQAFKLSAIDYLLKPVDKDELIQAIHKTTTAVQKEQLMAQLDVLAHNLMPKEKNRKIVLSDIEGLHIIDIPDICWCHAEGSYTDFQMHNGEKLTISKHLKTYENMLADHGFLRVHRSYLVNIYAISKLERQKGEIQMKNGMTLPILPSPEITREIIARLQN